MAFKLKNPPFPRNNSKLRELKRALKKMEKDLKQALSAGDNELARKIRMDIKSMQNEIAQHSN